MESLYRFGYRIEVYTVIGCLVVTHGMLADALVETARGILGETEGVHTMTVSSLPASEIFEQMRKIIEGNDTYEGILVLASLKGGSCWNAAVKLANLYPHVHVVSGVNLAMLISVLNKRAVIPFSQLAEAACRDGGRGIDRFPL